jgi:hypothetical protein
MKTKNEVKNNINLNQYSSLRVKITSKRNAMKILENVNKKSLGERFLWMNLYRWPSKI